MSQNSQMSHFYTPLVDMQLFWFYYQYKKINNSVGTNIGFWVKMSMPVYIEIQGEKQTSTPTMHCSNRHSIFELEQIMLLKKNCQYHLQLK